MLYNNMDIVRIIDVRTLIDFELELAKQKSRIRVKRTRSCRREDGKNSVFYQRVFSEVRKHNNGFKKTILSGVRSVVTILHFSDHTSFQRTTYYVHIDPVRQKLFV